MAATKRRLRKSVDAVIERELDIFGGECYWFLIPLGHTNLDGLITGTLGLEDDYTSVRMCTEEFEGVLGKFGLRKGEKAKVRITIERIK